MNQKRKFSFPLCRILFLIRWWIRWYTQCLIAQGHGLLRRTMQPSLLEGHSSKQHLMQLALWPKYFTWGFSQIPNFLQCYSHSIMQIGGLFRVSIFDWPKRQIQIEKINVNFLVRGIFISEMINLAGFILSERFPRTWVGLTVRWGTLYKMGVGRGGPGASCFSKAQAPFWMQELQQYPRPVYNSLVFASLLLSQSRHIQQTPRIWAREREGPEGYMLPPSWDVGMLWGGRRRRGTSEKVWRGNQWKPSREPSGFGRVSGVPVPNDGLVSTTWSRGRQAPREATPKTLSHPAWIVGLRGLWPSTKIWLSPPWRGWLCLLRFAPPSAERCSSLFGFLCPFCLLLLWRFASLFSFILASV